MAPAAFALALLATTLTHFLGAIAAYGSALLALPLLVLLTGDLQLSVLVLLWLGGVQALQLLCFTWRDIDRRELLRMLLWSALGLLPGFALANLLPQDPLLLGLAIVLLLAGLIRLRSDTRAGTGGRLPNWAGIILLIAAGLLHGAFSCGGAALVVYASAVFARKEPFRATLVAYWVIVGTLLIASWSLSAPPGAEGWALILAGLPLVLLAGWLGQRSARRLPQLHFIKLVAILLLVASGMTAYRALA